MPPEPQKPIFDVALDPTSGIGWRLGRVVAELHPGKFVLDGVQKPFDLVDFARESGRAAIALDRSQHAEFSTVWRRGHGVSVSPVNAVYDVTWEGRALRVVVAAWSEGYRDIEISLVVADDEAAARRFAEEVCAFCNEPRGAILRFTGGCFAHDRELFRAVADSSFDDLVLAGDLKERIVEDFTSFLGARAEYERYGVAYKRGVLLLGPPGNGKTHCLRALVKMLALPCIYVTSLKSRYGTEDGNIDAVFARAKEITPCILVFEDLDAMIHDKNRSFFLNKLDGLSNASGLVTLATTNHPARLDPAILERPSRFDRKYHFDLPGALERERYLAQWNARVDAAMRVEPPAVAELVEETEGFSFAYLKELWISAMIRWVHDRKPGAMRAHLRAQLKTLREQMRTEPEPSPATPDSDDDEP
jgi:hypothetical protein